MKTFLAALSLAATARAADLTGTYVIQLVAKNTSPLTACLTLTQTGAAFGYPSSGNWTITGIANAGLSGTYAEDKGFVYFPGLFESLPYGNGIINLTASANGTRLSAGIFDYAYNSTTVPNVTAVGTFTATRKTCH